MFSVCVCPCLWFMHTTLTWNTPWFSVDQMRRFLATRFWSTSTITHDGEWTGSNGALHAFAVKVIVHNGNSVSNQFRCNNIPKQRTWTWNEFLQKLLGISTWIAKDAEAKMFPAMFYELRTVNCLLKQSIASDYTTIVSFVNP